MREPNHSLLCWVATILVLLTASCNPSQEPVEIVPGTTDATAVPTDVPRVVIEPDRSPPVSDEARSLDLIRTRIARKEQGPATEPSPTPLPQLRVLLSGQSTVTAPETGLMWPREVVGAFTFDDARRHCRTLELDGHDDWQLPSIVELELVAFSQLMPADRSAARVLWTSTPYGDRGVETLVWPEGIRSHQETGLAHVICVRTEE